MAEQPSPPTLTTVSAYTVDSWQRLRWHKETRYYEAHLHQDLWGGWVITRAWGRRGSATGQVRHTPCDTYQQAFDQLQAITKRREQRGYVLIPSGF